MTKITIERETLKWAIRWHESRIWPGPDEVSVFDALRAALAQKAEPDEQEVALQEIAEFGQDQLREPRTQEEKEQYAFEDWLASECPSGDVESVQRQWEESAEYLELQDATPAQPADAQPTGQSPCARHCEAPAFEGEIRRLKREATIKDSLTIRPPAPAAVPLTDEQIDDICWNFNCSNTPLVEYDRLIARAIERAHGIAAAGDKP